jgi:hypothetical protein
MTADPVDVIARTLLYEGYLLYPYRRSALKNQQRFNFGVLHPRDAQSARAGDASWQMQTQCLALGGVGTTLDVSVRFLQLVTRADDNGAWQEAIERYVHVRSATLTDLQQAVMLDAFGFAPGDQIEAETETEAGAGATLRGVVEMTAEPVEHAGPPCVLLTVKVANVTPMPDAAPATRDAALLHAFVSTHIVLELTGGRFVSLLEPPTGLRDAASRCRNVGVWPVLVGEEGSTDRMLASPIILYDYPEIAPESAGDLFDGTEIDEILALRILTMTDDEKREARATDERARQILDRTEALGDEGWRRLHGAVRGLRQVTGRTP